MSKTIKLKFDVNEHVMIKTLKLEGRVCYSKYSNWGLEYYVKYYNDGAVKYDYFFEDELESNDSKKAVGFSD